MQMQPSIRCCVNLTSGKLLPYPDHSLGDASGDTRFSYDSNADLCLPDQRSGLVSLSVMHYARGCHKSLQTSFAKAVCAPKSFAQAIRTPKSMR